MPKLHVSRHEVTQPPDQSYRLIALTQGQNALVDAGDYEWLNQWNWQAWFSPGTKSYYAVKAGNIRMHRLILDCIGTEEGDHRNHDTLDNRRNNLRKCSHAKNCQNRGKRKDGKNAYKGVHWNDGTWVAAIGVNGKRIFLGRFHDAIAAARAYDAAAIRHLGEFCGHLNFPTASL